MELRDLQKMTVVKLRQEALQQGDISGVHGMDKQQIIEALASRLDIDLTAPTKALREKSAGDKPAMKRAIRALKTQREAALADHDTAALTQARKGIKRHKRTLRRMARKARPVTVE